MVKFLTFLLWVLMAIVYFILCLIGLLLAWCSKKWNHDFVSWYIDIYDKVRNKVLGERVDTPWRSGP